jgi:glutamine amidotransferase
MKVLMFDAGISNVHSIAKALRAAYDGADIRTDLALLSSADCLVLPGVGAFGPAAEALAPHRDELRSAISEELPVLGVCLGMQLLFDGSAESPGLGLGVLAGQVTELPTRQRPHMGWNRITAVADGPVLSLDWAYFAHSYVCLPGDPTATWATTTHDDLSFVSAVRVGSLWGVQFHPEKSSRPGIEFLRRFLREARCG